MPRAVVVGLVAFLCFAATQVGSAEGAHLSPLALSKPNPNEVEVLKTRAGGLTVIVDTKLGNYSIFVDQKAWFRSGATAFHTSQGWFASSTNQQGKHYL